MLSLSILFEHLFFFIVYYPYKKRSPFPITPPRFAPYYRTSSLPITVPKALPWQMKSIFITIYFYTFDSNTTTRRSKFVRTYLPVQKQTVKSQLKYQHPLDQSFRYCSNQSYLFIHLNITF